jgi:CBS domain-containing protein
MKIRELLKQRSGEVFRVSASDSVEEAAKRMSSHGIGSLMVEDATGNITGIISERDIVLQIAKNGASLQDKTVADLMSRDLIRCDPDSSVNQAMGLMTDRRIRHLPIFENDQMIGLVSIGDLVKFRIMEVQAESEALRSYIAS